MTDTEALGAIRREIEPLAPRVTAALNAVLPEGGETVSRWNGKIALLVSRSGADDDEGVLRRDGTIEISAPRADHPARWRTYLHELIHAHSSMFRTEDYQKNIGWEEGVVESLQRRIRISLLMGIGVETSTALSDEEKTWRFNPYIDTLDRVRQVMGVSEEASGEWYTKLLATPLQNRYASVLRGAMSHENKKAIIAELSRAQATLTRHF